MGYLTCSLTQLHPLFNNHQIFHTHNSICPSLPKKMSTFYNITAKSKYNESLPYNPEVLSISIDMQHTCSLMRYVLRILINCLHGLGWHSTFKVFWQDLFTDEIREIMRQRPGTRSNEQIMEVGGFVWSVQGRGRRGWGQELFRN